MQELTEFNLERTTTEILILKDQTAQNIIEIGKRLIEVKENLQHGEFTEWLKQKVDISHRTANNFMKVATTFSNSQSLANLGSTKLFLLAGLDEEDRQEVMQENNVEDITTRELDKVVKEKKEIKKQLEAEQEYSQELQEAIRKKEIQIKTLKTEIENATKPEVQIIEKEVVKEIIPENLILEKQALEKELTNMQEKLKQIQQKAEKAESALKSVKLESKVEQDDVYYKNNMDLLLVNIKEFLDKASKYTYFKEELQKIPRQKKQYIEKGVNSVKDWVMLMEQALENRQDIVGNIIYGKGEIINE